MAYGVQWVFCEMSRFVARIIEDANLLAARDDHAPSPFLKH